MYKICKTPKSEARQMEFQDTLIKLLEKQMLSDITIVSLCQEMKISRKTFYQYFDTIEDVLYATVDRELRNGFLCLEVTPEIDEFFVFWKKQKWLLDVLYKNGLSQVLVDRAYYISNFAEEGQFTVDNMKKASWISAIITVLVLWHHGGMQQTPEEMKQLLYGVFHVQMEK